MEIFKTHPFVHKIDSRIKSLDSIKEKIKRINGITLPDVRDIIGFRIIVPTKDDMIEILRLIVSELTVDEANFYNVYSESINQKIKFLNKLSIPVSFRVKVNPIESIFFYAGLNTNRLNLSEWSQFRNYKAEIQVMTIFGQSYIEASHALHYKTNDEMQIDIPAIDVASRLNYAVNNFQKLINSNDIHEKRDIHPFLEKHSFLLHPNPAEFFSEVAIGLGTEFKIDFLVRESDGKYLLVEIENPTHPLFTKAGNFSTQVNHAIRQVEDWQQWIEDNLPMVQKKYPDMMSPSGLVVIGRSQHLSKEELQRLERRNINFRGKLVIWTYDQLVESANSFIESIKRNLKSWEH